LQFNLYGFIDIDVQPAFQYPMEKDLQMEADKGKRRYQRYERNSPIHLYRMDFQEQYYYAEMKDYCQGGLSLLTNEKLVVGQLVYLEMKNYDVSATGPEKYKSYSGSVKWASSCSPSNGHAKGFNKYGVEYHEPVDYHC